MKETNQYYKSGDEIVRLIGISAVNWISKTERQVLWQCEVIEGEQLQESEQAGEIVNRWEHRLGEQVYPKSVEFGVEGNNAVITFIWSNRP